MRLFVLLICVFRFAIQALHRSIGEEIIDFLIVSVKGFLLITKHLIEQEQTIKTCLLILREEKLKDEKPLVQRFKLFQLAFAKFKDHQHRRVHPHRCPLCAVGLQR